MEVVVTMSNVVLHLVLPMQITALVRMTIVSSERRKKRNIFTVDIEMNYVFNSGSSCFAWRLVYFLDVYYFIMVIIIFFMMDVETDKRKINSLTIIDKGVIFKIWISILVVVEGINSVVSIVTNSLVNIPTKLRNQLTSISNVNDTICIFII